MQPIRAKVSCISSYILWSLYLHDYELQYNHQLHLHIYVDIGMCTYIASIVNNISRQATGLDAWASRVKCPARFVSHLHEICMYIWVIYSLFLLFVHYRNLMVCVVYWVDKWQSRGSTGMFGNLMAIYHIVLQFIQNHSRFVMLMIWK